MMTTEWTKSTECSMGTCVETRWMKSSACTYGDCVEMRSCDGHVQLRDSKNPEVVLTITPDDWQAFLVGVKRNEFDLPTAM